MRGVASVLLACATAMACSTTTEPSTADATPDANPCSGYLELGPASFVQVPGGPMDPNAPGTPYVPAPGCVYVGESCVPEGSSRIFCEWDYCCPLFYDAGADADGSTIDADADVTDASAPDGRALDASGD